MIKLTKKDFMSMPKERLADLLVEVQNELLEKYERPYIPPYEPTFSRICFLGGGLCTRPLQDCGFCPLYTTKFTTTSSDTNIKVDDSKNDEMSYGEKLLRTGKSPL